MNSPWHGDLQAKCNDFGATEKADLQRIYGAINVNVTTSE
jgi:hypothetical protein